MKKLQQHKAGVFIFTWLLSCAKAVPTVTVPTCTLTDVNYNVQGGTVGGKTYVESTTSAACGFTITDTIDEAFSVNFISCGATYTDITPNEVIEFTILVQPAEIYGASSATRFRVTCDVLTPSISIEQILNFDTSPDKDVAIAISPKPLLMAYTVDDQQVATLITSGQVIIQGQRIKLVITLDQDIPAYEVNIQKCTLTARYSNGTEVGNLTLTTETSPFCPLYPEVFPAFSYGYNTDQLFPFAEVTLENFMPTVYRADLRVYNLYLTYSCRTAVCLRSSGLCAHPTCAKRRKRDKTGLHLDYSDPTEGRDRLDDTGESTLETDDKGFPKQLPPNPRRLIQPKHHNEICMNKSVFWAIVGGLVLFNLVTISVACSFFIGFRVCPACRLLSLSEDRISKRRK